jgi:hypothetical protein
LFGGVGFVDAVLSEHAQLQNGGSQTQKIGAINVGIKGHQSSVARPHQSIHKCCLEIRHKYETIELDISMLLFFVRFTVKEKKEFTMNYWLNTEFTT